MSQHTCHRTRSRRLRCSRKPPRARSCTPARTAEALRIGSGQDRHQRPPWWLTTPPMMRPNCSRPTTLWPIECKARESDTRPMRTSGAARCAARTQRVLAHLPATSPAEGAPKWVAHLGALPLKRAQMRCRAEQKSRARTQSRVADDRHGVVDHATNACGDGLHICRRQFGYVREQNVLGGAGGA